MNWYRICTASARARSSLLTDHDEGVIKMEYKYNSAMLTQLRNIVPLFNELFDKITFDSIESMVPAEVMKNAENIIITGCGDSYCAAIASKPAFRGLHVETPRNIEAARYINTFKNWDKEKMAKTLVCAISVSGGPARPREVLLRFKEVGATVLAFTDHPESPLGQVAEYCVNMNVPKFPFSPLTIPYMASQYAVMMFGLTLSYTNGSITKAQAEDERQSIIDYINMFTDEIINDIDAKTLAITEKWLSMNVDQYDYIGDDQEYSTAFFGSAKLVESSGELTTIDDPEDWNHINFFNAAPSTTATLVVANEQSPSFSRIAEAITTARLLGRPVLVVTDSDKEFADGCDVFRLPKPKYRWVNAMLEHLPLDFVAAYVGLLHGRVPFRQDTVNQNEDPSVQTNPHIYGRFKLSKLEIVL